MSRVSRAFDKAGIPYVIIGGQAVIVHGYIRYTHDVDFSVGLPINRLAEVIRIRDALGLQPRDPDSDLAARFKFVLHCIDPQTEYGVDISFVDSPYLTLATERAKVHRVQGNPVRFLSVEDVLVHKVVAFRLNDQADVIELLNRGHTVDHAEVERWLAEFESVCEEPLCERYRELRRRADA